MATWVPRSLYYFTTSVKHSLLMYQELRDQGVTSSFETPKTKAKTPFSTPRVSNPPSRVFGRKMQELSKVLVGLGDTDNDVMVPKFVVNACSFIQVGFRYLNLVMIVKKKP